MIKSDSNAAYFDYLKSVSLFGKIYRRFFLYPRVNSHLNVDDVVDVGCGIGYYLQCISKAGSIGLDVNPFLVSYVKSISLNSLLISDGIFPLESHSRSSLFCDQVLEHIDHPGLFLSECQRILCKSGTVVFGVPCAKGFLADSDHKQFYNLSNMKNLLSPHFTVKYHFYSPLPSAFFGRFFKFQSLYVVCTSR